MRWRRRSGRLLALVVSYDGDSRSEAARIGGVGLQTVWDWVLRFNRDGPVGLVDGKALRSRPRLDATRQPFNLGDVIARVMHSGIVPPVLVAAEMKGGRAASQ